MIDRRTRSRSEARDSDAACADRRCSSSKPAARAWWRRLRPATAACLALAGFAGFGAVTLLPGGTGLEPSPVLADTSVAAIAAGVAGRAAGAPARRLLLSSHGRLQWLDVDTGAAELVHEGRGVYYGSFPADEPGRVWVVSRPHNWRQPPAGSTEQLLLLDTASGELLREAPLPSQFTHDAIRHGDKAYVADTGHGVVVELAFPSMRVERQLKLFTAKEHVNTLAVWPAGSPGAPADGGASLWAVLHNLGASQLAQVDLVSGAVVRRLRRVGDKAHGLSLWRNKAIMLSSGQGRLIAVDIESAIRHGDEYEPTALWEDPNQTFMKGLVVLDDVAYFGISKWGSRRERDDVKKTSEVAAFDLVAGVLLWRREVATNGLLNVVGAPHVSESATSVAQRSWSTTPRRRMISDGDKMVAILDPMPYVPYDPASGTPPRQIKLDDKRAAARLPPHRLPPQMAGFGAYVPLRHVDISALAARLAEHPEIWDSDVAAKDNAVLQGRENNMARFKPGCASAHFVFSDQGANACFHFPWWADWKDVLQPILDEILGWYGVPPEERDRRAVRLQLARMAPGGKILKHSDKGGWATGLHRIHIPVITNPDVQFLMMADAQGNFVPLHVAPGDVFEINNVIPHQVHNSMEQERVHLLLDFSESALDCETLHRGQKCEYQNQHGIKC